MSLYQPVITRKEIDDSHYYYVDGVYVPGVTTILHDTLPTPDPLRKWIGTVGNDAADAKLNFAAERGTKIHNACESLLRGDDVYLSRDFPAVSDKKCIVGFVNWVNYYKPVVDKNDIEFTVASRHGYAGTLDILCQIDGVYWIVDIKTSAGVYDAHKLQIIAYKQAVWEMRGIDAKVGILHLNPKVKKGYTFVDKMEIQKKELDISDFITVFELYKTLNGGTIKGPSLKNVYPDVINLYRKEVTE